MANGKLKILSNKVMIIYYVIRYDFDDVDDAKIFSAVLFILNPSLLIKMHVNKK